jgi:hypothetical protein
LTTILTSAGGRADALPTLKTGYADGIFTSTNSATRETWLGRAAESGASIVRVSATWRKIAPDQLTPGFEAANPASPGYGWRQLDSTVRSAAAHGLQVMLTVGTAPSWAEGAGRPGDTAPGSWRPSAAAYEQFAKALATRYSGSYPDPAFPGATLPQVRYFESWNEPNLDEYLSPQWEGKRESGAAIYRGLVSGFYAGIKSVQPDASVIAGSLAPFGDAPGGTRTPPVEFLRSMLCLRGEELRKVACPDPAHFDILSDHPIAVGGPTRSAVSPLDVTTPNLGRLTTVLDRAESANTVLPRGHKPLWVTEFWYDSNPPDPNGVPLYRQARWYEQDLYLFWKQGASAAITLQIRDDPPGKGYAYTSQAGIYFLDGTPKPSQVAFRFPFVVERDGKRTVTAWGIPPIAGRLKIQVQRGGHWTTIGKAAARAPRDPFSVSLPLQGKAQLRAVVGGEASLRWKLG